MNEIFKTLSDAHLPDQYSLRVLQFTDGEIVMKDILREGLGDQNYKELIEHQSKLKASSMAIPEG